MATDASTNQRTRVAVTVSKDAMTASVLLRGSKQEEDRISVEEIMEELERQGVVFGINEATIQEAVRECRYNTPVLAAVGRKAERGADSAIIYHFDTRADHKPKEDQDGRIDYKDISFIQNTEAGARLASRVPPAEGTPGMTVLGKELIGPPGRDLPFKHGINTEVSDDGLILTAAAAGAIQYHHDKISVLSILTVKGDVDHTVGNLDCRGSLKVTGEVKAGYQLKVDGDLEVNGNVEDADIHVGGSIAIKGGCYGEKDGLLEAGGDITVKYAEGQRLIAGGDITVGGEIVNCYVQAGNQVTVKGRSGKIVGGQVRARREIRAAVLGSEAGTATDLQVAYDPELMQRHLSVTREIQRLKDDNDRVKDGLYSLYRLKLEKELPAEKQAVLEKLESFQKELPASLTELENQKAEIEAALAEYAEARIICEETICPGVKASFGIIYREILEPQERCTLSLEAGKILLSDFRGD